MITKRVFGAFGFLKFQKTHYISKAQNGKKTCRTPLDDKNDNFLGHFAPDQSMVL